MLNSTHNGVLLPAELHDATDAAKDAYAADVKVNLATFRAAYFALEDAAARIGVELDS